MLHVLMKSCSDVVVVVLVVMTVVVVPSSLSLDSSQLQEKPLGVVQSVIPNLQTGLHQNSPKMKHPKCRNVSLKKIFHGSKPLEKIMAYDSPLSGWFFVSPFATPYMGVSKNRCKTPKMVLAYFMENPMNKFMIWGVKYPYFWFNTHIDLGVSFSRFQCLRL